MGKVEIWNFFTSVQLDIFQVSAVISVPHLASHVET